MRTHPISLLAVGLTLAACNDSGGPLTVGPPADGTLVVSTSTEGDDPDQDGYLLSVDGVDSLVLDPTGTAEIDLPDGQHTLRLLGVAEHCSVVPGTSLEVDVRSQDRTSVAFELSCPATGARITTTTTGLDIDPDGYRLNLNEADRGILPSTGTVLTQLEPGSHRMALTGLLPNCAIVGPSSHTVNIVASEIAPVEFAVVCTAMSGVIGVVVEASGTDVNGSYRAMVDGASAFRVSPNGPTYLTAVSAGQHLVSLVAPPNCSVEGDPQAVALTVGGLIRDTVEVAFSVTCVLRVPGRLRITAHTTGPSPTAPYSVWICTSNCMDYGSRFLGWLQPNGTLVSNPEPGRYGLILRDVPARCSVQGNPSSFSFTVTRGATMEIKYRVRCSP